MATDLKTISSVLLSSTAGVDMKTASVKRSLYTVPAGKTCVVTEVVVRSASSTLAGGTNYAFGWAATCNDWKISNNLSTVTATNHIFDIYLAAVAETGVAGEIFGMYITTGATNPATATIDVFGYLF